MSWIDKYLTQTATLWVVGANLSNRGVPSFAAPTSIACRWDSISEEVVSRDGQSIMLNSAVYSTTEISEGDYLLRGSSVVASPIGLEGAERVVTVEGIIALRGGYYLYVAKL